MIPFAFKRHRAHRIVRDAGANKSGPLPGVCLECAQALHFARNDQIFVFA